MPLRVLILHEQRLFREGLRAVLHGRGDLQVVADIADPKAAVEIIGNTHADVLIVDLSGAAAVPRTPPLVALGEDADRPWIARALQSGIRAIVSKSDSTEEVVAAIRAAAAGETYVTARLSHSGSVPVLESPAPDPLRALTARERQVFQWVIRGSSTAIIARHLDISPRTVETHRAHLARKLAARSAADLVRFAARHALLPS
jgi:DNA-binding NarL/FixJ family response regulator